MYREPCMKLITLRVPKISDSPAATKKSSMPLISPPVVWVTRQEADAKHASIACKSMIFSWSGTGSHYGAAVRARRGNRSLGVDHRFLPLGFVLENRLPVARGNV